MRNTDAETQVAMETIAEERNASITRQEVRNELRRFHFLFVILIIIVVVSENQKTTVFCIVPFFVSSMIDDTEKLSLMIHFSYCLRNNET